MKLFESDDKQPIGFVEAFAGALPERLLELFSKWLKAAPQSSNRPRPEFSFDDLWGYFRCELRMRVLGICANDMTLFRFPVDDVSKYQIVRKAMNHADVPASRRQERSANAARLPANTFDPIMAEVADVCSNDWIEMFVVQGKSWFSLDDDKIYTFIRHFQKYGMRLCPTKDKNYSLTESTKSKT